MTGAELARVLRAGADRARQYSYNTSMQIQAGIMEAMAEEAETLDQPRCACRFPGAVNPHCPVHGDGSNDGTGPSTSEARS